MKELDKMKAELKFVRKFTLRELLQEYPAKRGWGFANVLLNREYILAEECEFAVQKKTS